MSKNFDSWNATKKEIDRQDTFLNKFPKEGEVWIATLGTNIGVEQDGSGEQFLRPIIIIKKFNNHMFWAIPLSTKQKKLDFYFNFIDPNNLPVSAILAQMKLISVKRFKRKLYTTRYNVTNSIRAKLRSCM